VPERPANPVGDAAARVAWALARFPEVWVMIVPAIYLAAVVGSPLAIAAGHPRLGAMLFAAFHGWCHQRPDRTIFVLGNPMAVCARCFALAAGVAGGALVAGRIAAIEGPREGGRTWKAPFWTMCLAMVPMALDGISQLAGVRESTNPLRVATGLLLGGAVALWTIPVLYDAFDEQRRWHPPTGSS
jgi:uncharacterized membrane protein